MSVLVTGGSGQLATALAASGGDAVRIVGRPEFDFDRPDTLRGLLDGREPPSVVVNTAAYTAVDRAEQEPEAAMRANRDGPALLATLCHAAGIPLIHISTDYVFDGSKGAPYVETDATNPAGVYGASKRDGEQAVLAAHDRAVVLRTSWVYGAAGKNFVLTMLNAARKGAPLRVVADQRGCPTATPDLARAILAVTGQMAQGWRPEWSGVFHASGDGDTTWHGLATAAFEEAARHGMAHVPITAIATADWPTPARRPADSRLDCSRLERVFGVRLPHWRPALTRVIDAVAGG